MLFPFLELVSLWAKSGETGNCLPFGSWTSRRFTNLFRFSKGKMRCGSVDQKPINLLEHFWSFLSTAIFFSMYACLQYPYKIHIPSPSILETVKAAVDSVLDVFSPYGAFMLGVGGFLYVTYKIGVVSCIAVSEWCSLIRWPMTGEPMLYVSSWCNVLSFLLLPVYWHAFCFELIDVLSI